MLEGEEIMFYGQCNDCGERWELGTVLTCKCENEHISKDEALKLALEALEKCREGFEMTRQYVGYETLPATEGWSWYDGDVSAKEAIIAIKQALAAPVQVFDHVAAARQGLRDAQNRSRQISNLINCGTCGYPLAPEERTSLIERDGVMVRPAPESEKKHD
jgi:hypothetical protein